MSHDNACLVDLCGCDSLLMKLTFLLHIFAMQFPVFMIKKQLYQLSTKGCISQDLNPQPSELLLENCFIYCGCCMTK